MVRFVEVRKHLKTLDADTPAHIRRWWEEERDRLEAREAYRLKQCTCHRTPHLLGCPLWELGGAR